MNQEGNRGNSIIMVKSSAWVVKVGVYSSGLAYRHKDKTEVKLWKVKVIMN